MTTINEIIKFISFIIICWIIIHFGKNPRNGGKPPNDNKVVNIKNFIVDISLPIKNVWLINEIWCDLTIVMIVKVRIE